MQSAAIPRARREPALIELRDVCKRYASAAGEFAAVRNVSLEIRAGECVAVVGQSGSGKTTLINLLTGIDTPSAGDLKVAGRDLRQLSEDALAQFRGRSIGVVFQFFQLLPTLSVVENVMLPMDFCNTYPPAQHRARALELLDRLSIADQASKLPADLSGGQQQRAAIARALANDPPLVVADEPTGNLDSKTSEEVMRLLADLARNGKTVLTVTHEPDLSRFFTRVITLHDGAVRSDSAQESRLC